MNDLYVYDEIDSQLAAHIKQTLAVLGKSQAVTVHINSPGGSVSDALAIYHALSDHNGKVTSRVDGLAASAATLIMLAASEVVMAEHSLIMIHDPWTGAMGDAGEMRHAADVLDKHAKEMTSIYAERTGKDRGEVEDIMAAETWLNAEEAVAEGFAHRIEESGQSKPKLTAAAMAYLVSISSTAEAIEARRKDKVAALIDTFPESVDVQALKEDSNIMAQPVNAVRDQVMSALGRNITPTAHPRKDAGAFADNGNIVSDCLRDSLQARLGITQLKEQDNPYKHHSLFEMARASLVDRGISVATMGTKAMLVGAAFTHTSSDFGNILSGSAEKAMLRGWENSGETFTRWAKRGSLSNFHTAHRAGMGGFPAMPKVREGAEYQYVSTDDRAAPIVLATYGGLFSISRQAIINDDLSAFNEVPARMGRAASRTIGDLVYAVLIDNAKFTDGKALFHADHGNIGTTGAMSPDLLSEARHAMRVQTDSQGNPLNISPAFVIVPAALEGVASQILNSTSVPGAEFNSGIANPAGGMGELVVESRLDKSSARQWYVAAARGSDTVEVAYLDGVDQPYLEQQTGWTVDGVSFKARIDAGVAPLDYRGLFRGQVK